MLSLRQEELNVVTGSRDESKTGLALSFNEMTSKLPNLIFPDDHMYPTQVSRGWISSQ